MSAGRGDGPWQRCEEAWFAGHFVRVVRERERHLARAVPQREQLGVDLFLGEVSELEHLAGEIARDHEDPAARSRRDRGEASHEITARSHLVVVLPHAFSQPLGSARLFAQDGGGGGSRGGWRAGDACAARALARSCSTLSCRCAFSPNSSERRAISSSRRRSAACTSSTFLPCAAALASAASRAARSSVASFSSRSRRSRSCSEWDATGGRGVSGDQGW